MAKCNQLTPLPAYFSWIPYYLPAGCNFGAVVAKCSVFSIC